MQYSNPAWESKTIEELKAELEIHKRNGALLKVKQMEERILLKSGGDAENIDENPVHIAYKMREDGADWSDVEEKTGIKRPWLKVAKYAKDNDLPYNKNN